jgi:two-component system response regulator YesN
MPGLLVADDISIIRSHVARIVAREKPDLQPIVQASDGQEALSLVRQTRPDIILMDIKMPGLDGLQATKLIHAEYPATKTIILTAHDEFVYAQQALRLGAVDYIVKPVRPTQLVMVLTQVQAQIRLEQQRQEKFDEMARRLQLPPGEDRPAVRGDFQGPQDPAHQSNGPVQQAIAYIQQNLGQPEISLNMVASAVNLSTSHLAFLLKTNLGVSYIKYLNYLRLEQAKVLLKTTNLNIATVAEMVGYANPAYFYRLFQRETNMTPTAYRHADGVSTTLIE